MIKKLKHRLSAWLYVPALAPEHPAFWEGATHAILAAAKDIHNAANGGKEMPPVNLQQARQSVKNLFDLCVAQKTEIARITTAVSKGEHVCQKIGAVLSNQANLNPVPPAGVGH